jgi:CBS domain-containing protein
MNIQGYSSLVVTEDTTPVGIITNKDIRRRCVAEGLPITESIRVIMSNNVSNKMSTIDYSLGL